MYSYTVQKSVYSHSLLNYSVHPKIYFTELPNLKFMPFEKNWEVGKWIPHPPPIKLGKCSLQSFVNLDLASINRLRSSLLARGYTSDFIDCCVPAQCVHVTVSGEHFGPSVPCGTCIILIKQPDRKKKTKCILAEGVMKFSGCCCFFFYLHNYFL